MTGIRELFEEAGVLLQKSMTAKQAVAKPLNDHSWQDRVHDDAAEMGKLLDELQVAPAIDALKYWVTFITPKIEKRYVFDGGTLIYGAFQSMSRKEICIGFPSSIYGY